jgi:predicted DsbA family dithiol-disulfide isomerase
MHWHAYELRPEPVPMPDPDGEYIQEHWKNRVLPMAAERGLIMKNPRHSFRSRPALMAGLYAQAQGRFPAFDRALFRGRFEQDLDLSDIEVLKQLGLDAGLDPDELAYAVTSNAYLDELTSDIKLAQQLGINGVPIALVGPESDDFRTFLRNAEPVMGAVPYDVLDRAIRRVVEAPVP